FGPSTWTDTRGPAWETAFESRGSSSVGGSWADAPRHSADRPGLRPLHGISYVRRLSSPALRRRGARLLGHRVGRPRRGQPRPRSFRPAIAGPPAGPTDGPGRGAGDAHPERRDLPQFRVDPHGEPAARAPGPRDRAVEARGQPVTDPAAPGPECLGR